MDSNFSDMLRQVRAEHRDLQNRNIPDQSEELEKFLTHSSPQFTTTTSYAIPEIMCDLLSIDVILEIWDSNNVSLANQFIYFYNIMDLLPANWMHFGGAPFSTDGRKRLWLNILMNDKLYSCFRAWCLSI